MAYVNVKDWSVDQVTDWLKGLDNVILQYNSSFLNNGVTGHQLLNLRADDLEHLGVKMLGHQEIILEAVEHLRNFHFELDKENLQTLALKLSCAANSLYKELLLVDDDCSVIQTQVMSDVHNIITTIKPLVYWLDRSPFAGDKDYIDNKMNLLQLGFEMATSAHRGIFSEKPVCIIRKICEKLTKIADYIIQEMMDPMILQPASLDLATLKKKEQELGFFILPNNHAIHQIADIKHGSPAHGSSKIEEGDEIVQVNYQTVVGWQRKKVVMLLQESPNEIVLTLKKRPRHTKVYGQIYMKPYRLPSRKRSGQNWSSRWNENIPSPRLLPIIDLPPITIPKVNNAVEIPDAETELTSSDSEPPDSPLDANCRMYPLKPRPILQRRNTITGATPTNKRPYPSIEQYWEFMKSRKNTAHASSYEIDGSKFEEDSKFLRDKSASCNVALDLSPRPTTVLGITHSNSSAQRKNAKDKNIKKKVNFQEECDIVKGKNDKDEEIVIKNEPSNLDEEKSVSIISLTSLNNENITYIDEGRELTDRTSMAQDWKKEIVEEIIDTIKMKTILEEKPSKLEEKSSPVVKEVALPVKVDKTNSIVMKDPILSEINIHNIIRKFDEQKQEVTVKPRVLPRVTVKKPPEVPTKPEGRVKPVVPPRSATTKLRGKLDKSHSTPAYDLTEEPIEKTENLGISPLPEKPKEILKENIIIPQPEAVCEFRPPAAPESSLVQKVEIVDAEVPVTEVHTIEVPPKPPPRNVLDIPKPIYPVDSPKPVFAEISKGSRSETVPVKPVFDFSESKQIESISTETLTPEPILKNVPDDLLTPKCFEPKMVSTPVTKNKMDFEGDFSSKHLEPKSVSTPVPKSKIDVDTDLVVHKAVPSYEIQKGTGDSKVSPTNSIVKAMISSKCKAKKKNTLTAKRRKVTVNDLSPADIQGYLYQRLRGKHNQNVHWEKRWFVLLGNCLYGFRTKECPKAACLIFLSGFTVAVASEVKSRSNAFKVYHTGTVFYFSADDPDALQSWIDLIRTATLHNESHKSQDPSLYSETDESDTEKPKQEEKSDSLKKFGSLKKFTSKKSSAESSPSGSTSLDRKWFFNKSSNQPKHSLPVPTSQFRSYRKIRTTEAQSSITTGNFTSHVPMFTPQNLSYSQNVSVPNLTVEVVKPEQPQQYSKNKTKPINYIHASNPSLCNLTDFSVPGFTKSQFKPPTENLAGFVTLEELMIRQTEERKMNPHHIVEEVSKKLQMVKPEVVYGEVPIRPKDSEEEAESKPSSTPKTRVTASTEKHDSSSSCFGKRLGSLKKNQKSDDFDNNKTATYPKANKGYEQKVNRSLPRTHKIQGTYLKTESAAAAPYMSDGNVSAPSKERSYEMIYCPETVNDVQFAMNRALDDTMYHDTPKKGHKIKKQHSFSAADKKSKYTNKVHDAASTKVKLKSAVQYTPMLLPSSQDPNSKPKFAFELNLDEKSQKGGKLKQMFGGGKSESKKEKTFLGSPKLHRAIFKKHNSGSDLSWPSSATSSTPQISISQSSYSLENSSPVITEPFSMNISPHTDYPGLEYPPVFEAETYSLANPQSNLSILRKQGKNDSP
ncbi:connector enhancer of ksr [Leptinotarsa decemlineata]|uniref:connector enhancer of ksr n=1 Tax=Leptinotarsa decemlineata TaxID=7539 RepID=UPI003D30CB0F